MTIIEVLVADDHPLFVAGVRSEIEKQEDMSVVAVAETGDEVLNKVAKGGATVLLLDMQLPDMSGVEVARKVKKMRPALPILPLSGYDDIEFVTGMLELGAAGYLIKNESIANIIAAIRLAAMGQIYISPKVATAVISERYKSPGVEEQLTPILTAVLKLLALGLQNDEIATQLHRSEHTVKNNVCTLREITSTRSRAELVAWAWRHGFVSEM